MAGLPCKHRLWEVFFEKPVIAIGVFLMLVSIAGLIAACCRVSWLLWVYLLAMFLLIFLLFCFTGCIMDAKVCQSLANHSKSKVWNNGRRRSRLARIVEGIVVGFYWNLVSCNQRNQRNGGGGGNVFESRLLRTPRRRYMRIALSLSLTRPAACCAARHH